MKYSDFFVACGYERGKVLNEMQRVLTLTQEECLQTKERQPMDWIPLVTTYRVLSRILYRRNTDIHGQRACNFGP